jgi:8-oxo-dGTP diphosphatase
MIEVTCAIIKQGNKMLITQRSEQMTHPLKWEFPGGKVRPGESPERCLIREIKEELNVHIRVEQLLPAVVHDYGSEKVRLLPFVCSIRDGEIQLNEHSDMRWIGCNEVAEYPLLEADVEIVNKMCGEYR